AVGLLVLVRWTALTYIQLTGIPLVDFARIARYDPLVPVLGLAAFHVYLSARSRQSLPLYAAAGFLATATGLAHVYGLFWPPARPPLTGLSSRATPPPPPESLLDPPPSAPPPPTPSPPTSPPPARSLVPPAATASTHPAIAANSSTTST